MLRSELQLPARTTSLVVRPRRPPEDSAVQPQTALASITTATAAATAPSQASGGGASSLGRWAQLSRRLTNLSHNHPDLPDPDPSPDEVLVFFSDRIHVLEGGQGSRPFKLGPQLRIFDENTRACHRICDSTPCAVYDPYSDTVLFVEGYGIMALSRRNMVSLLAGNPSQPDHTDGPARRTRFNYIRTMAADGKGNVYVAESRCIRKLRLVVERAGSSTDGAGGGGRGGEDAGSTGSSYSRLSSLSSSQSSSLDGGGDGSGAEARRRAGSDPRVSCAEVTTLPRTEPPRDRWYGLAYDFSTDTLLAATDSAVYRVPLDELEPVRIPVEAAADPELPLPPPPLLPEVVPVVRLLRHRGMQAPPQQPEADADAQDDEADLPVRLEDLPADLPRARIGGAIVRGGGGGGAGAGAAGGGAVLLAGNPNLRGHLNGVGAAARFYSIAGMLAAAEGGVYVVDGTSIRAVDPSGGVREVLPGGTVPEESPCLAVLPHGCLAVTGSSYPPHVMVFLGLGFEPAAPPFMQTGAAAKPPGWYGSGGGAIAAGAARRAVLRGALLHQPESGDGGVGTAIVRLRVGDRRWVAHRAVLAKGSEYFHQLLYGSGGGFADGTKDEISLPEADPDAFDALLCYMYDGVLEISDPEKVRRAAELAGRLLMPDAAAELQRRLLAATSPETVAAELLWAETHHMTELVAGLSSYFVRHRRQVADATAPELFEELAACSPELTARLLIAVCSLA